MKECSCIDKDAIACASKRDKKYGLHDSKRKCPCFCHLQKRTETTKDSE